MQERTETWKMIIAWVIASLLPSAWIIKSPIAGNGRSRLIFTFRPVV